MKQYDYVPLIFVDSETGSREERSVEEVHSQKLNQWEGWYCASGNRSLYIDFDGNVFAGTCEVGGWRGNVFREGFDVPGLDQWIQCTKKFCSCGADMNTPKVKRKDLIPAKWDGFRKQIAGGFQSSPRRPLGHYDTVLCRNGLLFKLVIWDLGRRCNFACSYCYPGSHNNFESHKTLKSLQRAVDNVSDFWQRGERGLFSITGGEPTLHPQYIEFVEYILSRNPSNIVTTATNGSREPKYFSQLFRFSSLSFSAHLETLSHERAYANFVENIETLCEMKRRGQVPRSRFLQARIMLKPGMLDLARRLREDLCQIPDFDQYAVVLGSLLHESDERSLFSAYSEDEKRFVVENQINPHSQNP